MEPIQTQHYFKDIAQEFLVYCQYGKETPVAKTTLIGYARGMKLINKIFGDKPIEQLDANDVLLLRKSILERGCTLSYLHKILSMLRSVLRYCREERDMELFPLEKIKLPKIKWRDVEFYSVSQVEKIISSIETQTIHGIRFMAVVAGFLDSGMRISELLSLDRNSIDYGDGSAYIIGKGGKQRKVFFRKWSMDWMQKYLAQRTDSHQAMFVVHHAGYELVRLASKSGRTP
jgi:site-specific recombinase XerD